MCPPDGANPPIIEASPQGDTPDLTLRALRQRIRQQEILAELGVSALQGASLDHLLADTARLTAEGLQIEFCKVLEHIPSENRLLVRAGVGWGPDIVGVASVGADLASPAGFALRTGKPVISNHLENEERFRTPDILQQHGIRRAMNVILQGDGRPFGVLEADSRSEDEFEEHDLAFLQGAANLLGMAIERDRHEQNLKSALARHQFLLKEMNHRVKNSLAIVASMLHLQANEGTNADLRLLLEESSHRVTAVSRAHDQLAHGSEIERMDVGKYVESVCKDLNDSVAQCAVHTSVDYGIEIVTDKAISTALIVNELIANAAKYAYRGRPGGKVWVTVTGKGDKVFCVAVRDEGDGLPADFDLKRPKGLGMRIISSFSSELNASVTVRALDPGTEFVIDIPR